MTSGTDRPRAPGRPQKIIHSFCPSLEKLWKSQPPQIYWQTVLKHLCICQFTLNQTDINCATLHQRPHITSQRSTEREISWATRSFEGIPDSRDRQSISMKGAKRTVLLSLLVVVVASMVARNVDAACSLQQVAGCLDAVTKGATPTGSCCTQLGQVDAPCFCNLLANGKYSDAYVNNALHVPARCGSNSAAYAKFKGRNCAGKIPKYWGSMTPSLWAFHRETFKLSRG